MLGCEQWKWQQKIKQSPKAKENLQRNAELRQKDSKFIRLQPIEKRLLQFNPEKIEQLEGVQWKKDVTILITVTEPNNSGSENQEKYLTVGK